MTGRVHWLGKLHFCLILRNCHSHPRLRQPPPWSVSSHQHGRKTLQQQRHYLLLKDITTCWKFWWWLAFFSNKVFLNKVCTFFFQTEFGCTLNRLQYNVNRTFISTGKLGSRCDLLYCGTHFSCCCLDPTLPSSEVCLCKCISKEYFWRKHY